MDRPSVIKIVIATWEHMTKAGYQQILKASVSPASVWPSIGDDAFLSRLGFRKGSILLQKSGPRQRIAIS